MLPMQGWGNVRWKFAIDFSVVFLPFALVYLYEFGFLGNTYYDSTSGDLFYYWAYMSMGWHYSEWPMLLYNVSGGFLDHYPSIPECELAALHAAVFGWTETDFGNMAVFGIAIQVVAVVAAAAWSAAINRTLKAPAYLLLAASLLFATQPGGMTFNWSSYHHYLILLVPVGLGLSTIALGKALDSRAARAVFYAMGFALAMQYTAAIPIVAMTLAFVAAIHWPGASSVVAAFAADRFAPPVRFVMVALVGVFLIGFVLITDNLLGTLTSHAKAIGLKTTAAIAFGGVFVAAVALFGLRRRIAAVADTTIARLLFATAGRAFIGWGLGVNLLMFTAWHRGVAKALTFNEKTRDAITFVDIGQFLVETRPWLWVVPLLAACAVAMFVHSARSPREERFSSYFAGAFIIILVGANLLAAHQVPTAPQAAMFHLFGESRTLISVTAAIPIALVWLHFRSPRAGIAAACVAVTIAAFAVVDYHTQMAPVGRENRAMQRTLEDVADRFIAAHPGARVFCLSDPLLRRCMVDAAHHNFKVFYVANAKNPPLPQTYGTSDNRFVPQIRLKDCTTVESCLGITSPRDAPIVVIAPRDRVPPMLRQGATELLPSGIDGYTVLSVSPATGGR